MFVRLRRVGRVRLAMRLSKGSGRLAVPIINPFSLLYTEAITTVAHHRFSVRKNWEIRKTSVYSIRYHRPQRPRGPGEFSTLHNHLLLSRSRLGMMPFHASSKSSGGASGSSSRSKRSLVFATTLLRDSRCRSQFQSPSRSTLGCKLDPGSTSL